MDNEAIRRLFSETIAYLLQQSEAPLFQGLEQQCGVLKVRLALTDLFSWLRYVHRYGKSRDCLKVRSGSPLLALSCLLAADGQDFSAIFQLTGSEFTWRESVSSEVRAAIVQHVGENWSPRVRE